MAASPQARGWATRHPEMLLFAAGRVGAPTRLNLEDARLKVDHSRPHRVKSSDSADRGGGAAYLRRQRRDRLSEPRLPLKSRPLAPATPLASNPTTAA